jgi:hypothetical protein
VWVSWDYRHCKTFRTICFHFAFKVILPFSRQTQKKNNKMASAICAELVTSFCGCVVPSGTTFVLPDDVDCTGQLAIAQPAITMQGDAVVDLNGLTLTGDSGTSIGIRMTGAGKNKVEGHGGTIDGFDTGIEAGDIVGADINGLNFVDQGGLDVFDVFDASAVRLYNTADAKITECLSYIYLAQLM